MKKTLKLTLMTTLLVVALVGAITAAAFAKAVTVKGSDTMLNLGTALAEEFNKITGIPVTVSGGGSGVGIAALIAGNTDICQSSREIKPAEVQTANQNGVSPKAYIIAYDGISIIVHKNNTVSKLTMEQVYKIFTAKVTNWKELGGKDAPIVVLSREATSGTHVFLKEHVLQRFDPKAEYAKTVRFLPSNQAIHDEVEQNENAIGYIGLGYVDEKIKTISIAMEAGKPYVAPSVATVKDNTYPISRPLYWYTNGRPTGDVLHLLHYAISTRAQPVIADQGFVTVK
jgi:phosphate transport system substrate-binding protein